MALSLRVHCTHFLRPVWHGWTLTTDCNPYASTGNKPNDVNAGPVPEGAAPGFRHIARFVALFRFPTMC